MFTKSPTILLTALLGALCLGGAGPASAQSQAVQLADGWSYDGAVEPQDRVELAQTVGESPVLAIEKRSPFQADKFLQVYKHFAGQNLQGKRIRMTFEVQTVAGDAGPTAAHEPKRTIVTRVQCVVPTLGRISIYTSYRLVADGEAQKRLTSNVEFVVPDAAQECTLGFALARPLEMTIRDIKFAEVKAAAAAGTTTSVEFPLPSSTSDLPTLELSPPAPAK